MRAAAGLTGGDPVALGAAAGRLLLNGEIRKGKRGEGPAVHCWAVANRTGETGSFEELAMPLFGKLYNFACWLTQDRAAAEDLVQETYLKALRGFASYRQGTNFRAWLYKILRNTFLTSQVGLKAWATDSLEGEGEPETIETPETMLLVRVERKAIEDALDQLPVIFREVLLLCDVEEMSYQEIGETLGIPIGTVMSRLSRARRSMRGLLAARGEGACP